MHLSAQAVVIKYHRQGYFNNRNLLSHTFGGWKAQIKMLAGLVSSEASFFGLQMATFSPCPHMVFICAAMPGICECWIRAHPNSLFYLNHLFKYIPISKYSHI